MNKTLDTIDDATSLKSEPDMLQEEYKSILNTIRQINSSAIEKEPSVHYDELGNGDGGENYSCLIQRKLKSPLSSQQIKNFISTPIKANNGAGCDKENDIQIYAIVFTIFSRLIGSGLRMSVSYLETFRSFTKRNIVFNYDKICHGFAKLEALDRNINTRDAKSVASFLWTAFRTSRIYFMLPLGILSMAYLILTALLWINKAFLMSIPVKFVELAHM